MSEDSPPHCPYCGDIAPYGDERHMWISAHLCNRPHRWWWKVKEWWGILFYPPI